MRKLLTAVLGLSVVGILIYGAIGSGAMFTFTGTADQQIAVGTLGFSLDSDTPGAYVSGNTLTCPALAVDSSSNWTFLPVPACDVELTRTGSIPAAISVFAQVLPASTLPASSWDSFILSADATPAWLSYGGPKALNTAAPAPYGFSVGVVASPALNGSVDFDFAYDWGQSAGTDELVNGDMGKTLVVQVTFSASN
jgi:hypothetical protein